MMGWCRATGQAPRSWNMQGSGYPPGASRGNTDVDFSPEDPFQTSDVQNHKMISLSCFKPRSLWLLVTAATGNRSVQHPGIAGWWVMEHPV